MSRSNKKSRIPRVADTTNDNRIGSQVVDRVLQESNHSNCCFSLKYLSEEDNFPIKYEDPIYYQKLIERL